MNNMLKKMALSGFTLYLMASLTACGNDSSSGPTTVPTSATVFYAHNLVFRNNTTFSAGYNAFGQLGTGDLANKSTPSIVQNGLFLKGGAIGGNHSVAFINNSTVRSWGYNAFGQLGNDSIDYSNIPVKTVNLSKVTAVAAGSRHSLALTNDTVWAWGSNEFGQLGKSATDTAPDGYKSKVPVKVTAGGADVLFNITAIAANGFHSLALADGKVWAWGLNKNGQLGIDPISTYSSDPVLVTGLPLVGTKAIAAGGAFNYALANDSTVYAWGNNDFGQLGNNSTTGTYIPGRVMIDAINPLTNVVQIAAGIQHGLAILADGSVWAWGYNIYGQLGNGTKKDSLVAVQVLDPTFNAKEIRAFGSSSMARNDSGWYVWGDNSYGQLGTGGTGALLQPVKLPGF
jgi:alpha-tubulin suppressor-like RCC1 family protein